VGSTKLGTGIDSNLKKHQIRKKGRCFCFV
jgi:hypothetical protein